MLQVGRLIRIVTIAQDHLRRGPRASASIDADTPAGPSTSSTITRRKDLFVQALLHRSFPRNPSPNPSNERLEFLVIRYSISSSASICAGCIRAPEGDLTKFRSRLVNRKALAAYGKELHLSTFILMSPSAAQSVGKGYETIVSDTFEALVAAIYLDSGYTSARRFVERQVTAALAHGTIASADENYKSRLLEYAQSHGFGVPRYMIVKEEGPDRDRVHRRGLSPERTSRGGSGRIRRKPSRRRPARPCPDRLISKRTMAFSILPPQPDADAPRNPLMSMSGAGSLARPGKAGTAHAILRDRRFGVSPQYVDQKNT
jgi:dsRNA-specific ribonuclease